MTGVFIVFIEMYFSCFDSSLYTGSHFGVLFNWFVSLPSLYRSVCVFMSLSLSTLYISLSLSISLSFVKLVAVLCYFSTFGSFAVLNLAAFVFVWDLIV